MSWQRARQPEQKAARIAGILEAAGALFDQRELADISMREIAERAELGKASLYHYFRTREEVFLALYRHELDHWLADAHTRLGRLRQPTAARVAKVLTEILQVRPRFCRLTVVLSTVLEQNLSREVLVEFKSSLLEPFAQFVATLRKLLPDLSSTAAQDFLFQYHASIAGLWPLAHPSPEVEAILTVPEFELFRVEFHPLLTRSIRQLLESGCQQR